MGSNGRIVRPGYGVAHMKSKPAQFYLLCNIEELQGHISMDKNCLSVYFSRRQAYFENLSFTYDCSHSVTKALDRRFSFSINYY